jgi:hypothetical protein
VELQGTVTALAETNVNWKDLTFRDNWETLLQCSYSTIHFSHSLCDDGHHKPMQQGETSMICNHRLGAKLVDKGCDNPMGRWSWMKFRGKRGTKVLVISAYQVSQTSARGLGMETVYMQHWRKLAKIRVKVNPWAQFWEDLTLFICQATASQEEVLLMIDANADIYNPQFVTFLLDCGLHDLHANSTLDLPPETYYRGTKKIDFCLGTGGVLASVMRTGITSNEGGLKFSNHRALFVDTNEEALFTSQGADSTSQKGRGLQVKNKHAVKKYREVLRTKLLAHNIFERCQTLAAQPVGSDLTQLQQTLDTIDAEITKAAL